MDVAFAVGDALRRAGIRAVLTGGACANLYSGGAYISHDADFVLSGSPTREEMDRALAPLGFVLEAKRYVHPLVDFYVDFPPGPLGIGSDREIKPVVQTRGELKTLSLSVTDSCRDRLAAAFHWPDPQSLATAAEIAARNNLAYKKIREWSIAEGYGNKYDEFLRETRRIRARMRAQRTGRL